MQSSSNIGVSSAQVSTPLSNSVGSSITAVVPIVPIGPRPASSTATNTQGGLQTGLSTQGSFFEAVPNISAGFTASMTQTLSSNLPSAGSLVTQLSPSSGPTLQSSGNAIASSQSTSVQSISLPTPVSPIFNSVSLPPAASLTFGSTSLPPTASLILSSAQPLPAATGCPTPGRWPPRTRSSASPSTRR